MNLQKPFKEALAFGNKTSPGVLIVLSCALACIMNMVLNTVCIGIPSTCNFFALLVFSLNFAFCLFIIYRMFTCGKN